MHYYAILCNTCQVSTNDICSTDQPLIYLQKSFITTRFGQTGRQRELVDLSLFSRYSWLYSWQQQEVNPSSTVAAVFVFLLMFGCVLTFTWRWPIRSQPHLQELQRIVNSHRTDALSIQTTLALFPKQKQQGAKAKHPLWQSSRSWWFQGNDRLKMVNRSKKNLKYTFPNKLNRLNPTSQQNKTRTK